MKRALWFAAAVALVACTENSGPGGVDDAQLNVVRQDSLAPPLLVARDSFWAKVGVSRELRMFYQGGAEFVRFEVASNGLYRKPDGSAFQPGDSILITVTVTDPSRFVFEFTPSNLQFNPENPARFRVRYANCDKDFDRDGDEDPADTAIETELDLWHRAVPGALWFKVGAVKFEELDEIDANIRTFSQYAVAW